MRYLFLFLILSGCTLTHPIVADAGPVCVEYYSHPNGPCYRYAGQEAGHVPY